MQLRAYLDEKGRGEISRLVREAGCAATTLYDVLHGKPIAKYETAKRISEATGGQVTIDDLCGPQPQPEETEVEVEKLGAA